MALIRITRRVAIVLCCGVVVFLAVSLLRSGRSVSDSEAVVSEEHLPEPRVVSVHAPAEIVELRDTTTRTYKVIREVEITDPVTRETRVEQAESRIIEKANNLCYRDEWGSFVPSIAEFEAVPGGFVADRNNFGLGVGETLGQGLTASFEGLPVTMRAAYLVLSDGTRSLTLAEADPDSLGELDVQEPSVVRFSGAFGDLADLEYIVRKGGYHQNVVINKPIALPTGFDPDESQILVYSEFSYDDLVSNRSVKATDVNGEINLSALNSFSAPSEEEINFQMTSSEGKSLHLFSFGESEVWDSAPDPEEVKRTVAGKQLFRSKDAITYLVETVSHSFLRDARYPVVVDYVVKTGSMTQDEIWSPPNTYYITGTLTVSGATLTIRPGTTIKFEDGVNASLEIGTGGCLKAEGEPYNYIVFTSKKDDQSGEDLTPGSTSGSDTDYAHAIRFLAASPQSIIKYCKIAYASHGIRVSTSTPPQAPIENNIISDCDVQGIGLARQTNVKNNLIIRCYYGIYVQTGGANPSVISNNTFKDCYRGLLCYYDSVHVAVKYNLFSGGGYAVYNVYGNVVLDYNAYYHVAYDETRGCDPGENDVFLPDNDYPNDSPFDSSLMGSYYLKDSMTQLKGKPCLEPEMGFEPDFFTTHKPEIAPTSITGNENVTWEKVAHETTSDEVDIGYHHNRVDYYMASDCTVSGGNASLTINPGVAVAINGFSLLYPASGARLTSVGEPLNGGYNVVTNSKSASMLMQSPVVSTSNPMILIGSDASDQSAVEYTKFTWLTFGVGMAGNVSSVVKNNIFAMNHYGVYKSGGALTCFNNLFHHNNIGARLLSGDAILYNNTFDSNTTGIDYERSAGRVLFFKDNLFTLNGLSVALRYSGDVCQHNYNVYWGTPPHIYDYVTQSAVDIGPQSRELVFSPYDAEKGGWEAGWYLKQKPDDGEAPEEVLAVDCGSQSAQMAALDELTTSVNLKPDAGDVDAAYHRPINWDLDGDSDGMPDWWEDQHDLDPESANDAVLDPDDDQLANLGEYQNSADPGDSDTDDDSINDGEEVDIGTSPAVSNVGTVFVSAQATPPHTGTYAQPYDSIQTAIENFDHETNDFVFVLQGTYYELIDMRDGVSIYAKPSLDNPTVIDGGEDGPVVWAASATLEGFTVRNGQYTWGGGICGFGCSPVFRKCVVRDNVAENGAGMYLWDCSAPVVDGCIIVDNSASCDGPDDAYGGGIVLCACGTESNPAQISDSIIAHNTADLGSGIKLWPGGGSGYSNWLNVANSLVVSNECSLISGGAVNAEGAYAKDCVVSMTNCTVAFNSGGGIKVLDYAQLDPVNSIIWHPWLDIVGGSPSFSCIKDETISGARIIHYDPQFLFFPAGTITSAQASSVTVGSAQWEPNQFAGAFVQSPLDPEEFLLITANSQNTLTVVGSVSGTWASHPCLVTSFHLSHASPCINTGDNDAPGLPPNDIHGDDRIIGPAVDIGADEFLDQDLDGLPDDAETLWYHTDPGNRDSDGDGMLDGWEVVNGLDPLADDALQDADADGLPNLYEFLSGSDPHDSDTDDDGLNDQDEAEQYETSPSDADTDADGLNDYQEVIVYGTYAASWDTDYDGMPDGWEVANSLNPNLDDSADDPDVDWVFNFDEYERDLDPQDPDSDDDGLADGVETNTGIFVDEDDAGSDPKDPDTDDDGLTDGQEVNTHGSNPNDEDSDDDSLSDDDEVVTHSTSPTSTDSDGDGYSDSYEIERGTGPDNSDDYPGCGAQGVFDVVLSSELVSDAPDIVRNMAEQVFDTFNTTVTLRPGESYWLSGSDDCLQNVRVWNMIFVNDVMVSHLHHPVGGPAEEGAPMEISLDWPEGVPTDLKIDLYDHHGDQVTGTDPGLWLICLGNALDLYVPGVAAHEEEQPGVYIAENDDDDDGSGTEDKNDPMVVKENDLLWISVELPSTLQEGTVTLERSNANIRVWKNAEKGAGNEILVGQNSKQWNLATEAAEFHACKNHLYVEGATAGYTDLTVSYADGQSVAEDTIRFTTIDVDIHDATKRYFGCWRGHQDSQFLLQVLPDGRFFTPIDTQFKVDYTYQPSGAPTIHLLLRKGKTTKRALDITPGVNKEVYVPIASAGPPLLDPGDDYRLEAQAPGSRIVTSVPLRCTRDFTLAMMRYYFEVNPPETEVAAVAKIAEMIAPYYVCTHGAYNQEDEVGFGRELWGLCSQNSTPRFWWLHPLIGFPRLGDYERDVFGQSGFKPDDLGWKAEYIDTNHPEQNQRHHFAFWYAAGVEHGDSEANMISFIGDYFVDDTFTGKNWGDIYLGWDAVRLGCSTSHMLPQWNVSILQVGQKIMEKFSRFQ